MLDTSDPDSFDRIVNHDNIIEIIDHHPGHENFWRGQKNVKVQIEPIGSVATIIYEKFVEKKLEHKLSPEICKLLACAIVDNTLNLRANITKQRDITAYNELIRLGGIDENFVRQYFEDCETAILNDLEKAINNDTKNFSYRFGQIAIYNHGKVLSQLDCIKKVFAHDDDWLVNLISLKNGKSYLITTKQKSKDKLKELFNKDFDGDILTLDKFMLRKEILAKF